MGKQTVLKISKILCVIVVAILFWTTGINAQERQNVRVGYFRYDNFNDATEGGEKSGYGYDILQKLRIYENWNYEYVGYDENTSWQDMLKLLENGEIDLLAPVNYTETRHEKFDYASLPMGTSSTVISVHANNRKYSTTDYSNWNNVSVGMIVSNNQNSSFHNYAAKHGFTYKSVLCENTDELFAKLQSGEVDMIVTSSLLKLTDVWILDEFEPLDVYYVVRKGNTALLMTVLANGVQWREIPLVAGWKARATILSMRSRWRIAVGISALSVGETSLQVLQENMKKIHDSGTYLLGLINDTLNLQRIESGKLTLVPTVVSLKAFITGSTEIIREMAKEKGVEFRISTNNEDLQGYVRMDSMRMKQIVMNLLSNAIKFTPAGGTVELAFTVLGRTGKIVHDRITVTDTGIGMSRDFIEHKIFKPFSQEHNAWTDSYAGSGLGLSIVKRLVDMMGATIAVESEPGVGTKVTINIDFECVDEKDVVQVAVKQKESKEAVMEKLHGKQVLIAEDQTLNAEIATRLLEKAGCDVVWVKNGLECVKTFTQSAPGFFNIILMDIRMPVMDGLAATQAIRASSHPDAKSIPIVAMTANAYESDVKKSLDAGMNAHLAKPINPQTMYETIAKAIMQG